MKRAFIVGITGQDGSLLAELLLKKEYEVHGIIRRSSSFNTGRIDHLNFNQFDPSSKLRLHFGDLQDGSSLQSIISKVLPDEFYNLGAQSHVKVSFEIPEYTGDVTGLGTLRVLDAIRTIVPSCKFYQASSSEVYGSAPPPQNESTPFHPRSPYGAAKAYAFYMTQNYREAYGMFACNGILFNHESPVRGQTFVTRKITRAVGRIVCGLQNELFLGNLEAKRDWGNASEYVEAMWLMLQQKQPDDYVIGTGETHSVREFVEEAFSYTGLDWTKYVKIDPKYFRPSEVDLLLADASKARSILGWSPKTTFKELVHQMVDADLKLAERERREADLGRA